jgi:hypothetical protein
MIHLSENWLTEHLIDAEYKQFVLLAYLEGVRKQFHEHLLYPGLAELVEHYRKLHQTRREFEELYKRFPAEMKQLDLKKLEITYEKAIKNDSLISELEQIIEFSIPKMQEALEEGRSVYSDLEKLLKFEAVGLIPLSVDYGYLLMETAENRKTHVYEYQLSIYTQSDDSFRSLSTQYITSITRSAFETPESIKLSLIKERKEMPNPATYYFNASVKIPFEQAYLPIAKRLLMKEIGK